MTAARSDPGAGPGRYRWGHSRQATKGRKAKTMRQEVEATVRFRFDCDAGLNRSQIAEAIRRELNRLADADSEARAEMVGGEIVGLREEAEIYGNATSGPLFAITAAGRAYLAQECSQ